jgi:preprotein translocase subunit YajC
VDAVSGLLPFVLILVAFYFLIVRPARTRQRAAVELQERLAPGVEVMTTSGIYGTVVAVDDTTIQLEVAPGPTVRVAKPAVGQVLTGDDAAAADDAGDVDDAAVDDADGSRDDAATRPGGDPTDPRDDHSTR